MRLLAAALSGVTLALVVGWMTGGWPLPRRLRLVNDAKSAWLQQSGVGINKSQFRLLSFGSGLLGFLAVWSFSGLVAVSLPAGAIAALGPRAFLMRRRDQHLLAIQTAWPDGIRDLIGSIASGMSLGRALETLALNGPLPLREAFARYPSLARLLGVAGALEIIRQELAHPASDRVIEVLIVAQARGGPIVLDILRDLAMATTRDVWAYEEIESLALEQKLNARVVFFIPWAVLAFITIRPGPFRDFYASPAGWLVVGIGALASLFGMVLASRLGRQADEPRVFGGSGS